LTNGLIYDREGALRVGFWVFRDKAERRKKESQSSMESLLLSSTYHRLVIYLDGEIYSPVAGKEKRNWNVIMYV
jgi:hypothetical protein